MSYTPTTTKYYLDDAGLNYLINTYVIKRQVGNAVGDMIYISSAESGIIGQPGYTPPSYSKVGGTIGNYKVPMALVGTSTVIQWNTITAAMVSYGNQTYNTVDSMLTYLDTTKGTMNNPMTSAGDIIYGGTSGTPTRLAGSATNGYVLKYNTSTNKPEWAEETVYGADRGISIVSNKYGHSNTAITAQTTQGLYPISMDAYGHILSYGSEVLSLRNPYNLYVKGYSIDSPVSQRSMAYIGSDSRELTFNQTDFGVNDSGVVTSALDVCLRYRMDSNQFTDTSSGVSRTPGTKSLNTITTADIDAMFS